MPSWRTLFVGLPRLISVIPMEMCEISNEFMRRISVVIHGTLGSCLHVVVQGGCVDVVACSLAMWA
jgi:hypothetical protein